MLEGRFQQPAAQGQCPVCFAQFPGSTLEEHCRTHFSSPEPAGSNGSDHHDKDTLCPLGCGQKIQLADLASHEMLHRLQEEEDRKLSQEEQTQFEALQAKYGTTDKRGGESRRSGQEGHWSQHCPQKSMARSRVIKPTAADIIAAQRPATFHRTNAGLITLMKQALLAQRGDFRAVLSGHVDHYQATHSDLGWGCGWRNIQMLSSHLVQRDPALRGALFGGCGFVPDIGALQAWLEAAWAAGYDAAGAEQLGNAVQGTHKWVGTTEAATLLRLFGVRAFVVDFRGGQSATRRRKGGVVREEENGKRNPEQEGEGSPPDEGLVWGGHMKSGSTPGCTDNSGKDVVHEGVQCDACAAFPIRGLRYKSQVMEDYDLCSRCRRKTEAEAYAPFTEMRAAAPKGATFADNMDHSVLVNWVWQYFTGEGQPKKDGSTAAGVAAGDMAAPKLAGGESVAADWAHGPPQSKSDCSSNPDQDNPVEERSGPVMLSHKPPLYFQHEGHSRTIVGVEWLHKPGKDAGPSVHLLVLDPSQGTASLEKALRTKEGWQRLVKRSTATLQKPEYQLLFCEDGLASSKEQEKLKVMATYQNFGF